MSTALVRWIAWAATWLVCIALFDWSLRGACLMLAGVFAYQLGRFVDYVIVEIGR